jgi:lipopolysaccharide exporter
MHFADEDKKPEDLKSINAHMVQGTAWMVSMRWSLKLIGVVNTVIIARLLAPDDFGVIAMAMIIVGFLTTISETNVAIALIRNKEADRDDYNSAWTIKVITGVVLTIILIGVAPFIATYYGDPRVEIVIQIISLRCVIIGFENIGVVDFRKNMLFAKEFRYWVYRRLTDAVISLAIVFLLRDYFALAISMLVSGSIMVFYSFTMSSYRPWFSLKKWRSLWLVSQWLMVEHGCTFVGRRIDELVIGGAAGSIAVGNYYMASEVSAMPTREVIMPAGRALMPTYAKVVDNKEESRKAFLRVLGFVAIYSLPAGVGISLVSSDLVPILLGAQWTVAIPLFQWLGIYASFEAILLGVQPYFLAHGGERAYALTNLGFVFVLVPAIVGTGYYYDAVAIAMVRTGLGFAMVVAMLAVIVRLQYATLRELISVLWRPFIASAVMWVGVRWLPTMEGDVHVVPLLRDTAVGFIIFSFAVTMLWLVSGRREGAETIIFQFLSRLITRNRQQN